MRGRDVVPQPVELFEAFVHLDLDRAGAGGQIRGRVLLILIGDHYLFPVVCPHAYADAPLEVLNNKGILGSH
jgi:hypothetical protein